MENAPDAGRWVQSVTDKAGQWLQDADVPEHVRAVAHRLKDSDAPDRMVLRELGAYSTRATPTMAMSSPWCDVSGTRASRTRSHRSSGSR